MFVITKKIRSNFDPLSLRWSENASQDVWRLDQIFSFPEITIFSYNEFVNIGLFIAS